MQLGIMEFAKQSVNKQNERKECDATGTLVFNLSSLLDCEVTTARSR
jgi:hypothetical protein